MADKNSINLGRVLPIYKGDWSADTNYDILDIVYYNGNSYTAKQPSTNQEPKADSAYWGLSSVKGQKGDKGDKGDTGPQGPAGKDADMPIIGGRNLLLDTGRSFTGVGTNSINGNFNAQDGNYYLAGGKKVSDFYNQYGSSGYLTLSFDWVASGSTISGKLNPVWNNTPWGGLATTDGIQPSSTNKTGHYEITVSLNATGYSTGTATSIIFRQDNLQGNITISNVKLEAGNVATDWTPAPEDVSSATAKAQTTADNAMVAINNYKYQTNLLVNSDFYYDLQGWDITGGSTGANKPYASYINKDVKARVVGFNTTSYTDRKYSRLRQTVNLANNPTGQSKITVQWQAYAPTLTTYGHLFMSFFTGFDGTGDVVVLTDVGDSQSKVGDNAAMWDWVDKSLEGWAVRHGTTTIPDNAKSVQLSFETVEGNILYLANPMLAFGDSISTYTSGPYYPKDDIQSLKDHAIRDNVSGQSVQGDFTVGHIMEADWLYKHVSSAGATPLLEMDDTNLNNKQAIGHYYSAFTHGSGVALGAGGLTIVGGGESAKGLGDAINTGLTDTSTSGLPISDHGNETAIIASDGYIYFMPGQQAGYPTLGPSYRLSNTGTLDKYSGSGWSTIIPNTSGVLAQDSQVVHKSSDESIAGDKKFSGKVTVDNAAKYPLNASVPLNSTKMLYGTISAIRVGNLVQATYNKPNSTDKVGVNTTSSESVPADFRPLAGVKGAGTDSSGGTVDITLNPNGTLTTGNTYIDSGKSATITFTYPVL